MTVDGNGLIVGGYGSNFEWASDCSKTQAVTCKLGRCICASPILTYEFEAEVVSLLKVNHVISILDTRINLDLFNVRKA